MTTKKITSHEQLKQELAALRDKRDNYKKLVIADASELYTIVKDPVPLLKQTARRLAGDSDFRFDLLKIGVNLAGNYMSGKSPIAGLAKIPLVSMIVEKTLGTGAKHGTNLAGIIARFFRKKK
jgi:hypothetical protein